MLIDRKLYIFDLDGTLVNSEGAIKPAFDTALAHCDFPPMDNVWFRSQIGTPLMDVMAEHLSAEDFERLPDTEFLQVLRKRFFELVQEHSHALPTVGETLRTLKARGKLLAVATNKPAAQAHAVLEAVHLDHLFDHVVGIINEDPKLMKPHPAMINRVLEHFNLPGKRAVMVGDTWRDIAAGKAAECATIAISTGAEPRSQLEEHNPHFTIDTFSEIIS